jgi:hypothetical protein
MLTQTVLGIAFLGQLSAAWIIPLVALQIRASSGRT